MTTSRVKLDDAKALRAYAHPLRLRLVALLRRSGPLTATQAAERLDDNVPNCSFHLRQLAKYGLVERVPGADGREKPWQATSPVTSWEDDSPDPEVQAATDQLNVAILAEYNRRAQAYLARRSSEPVEWRSVTGFGDYLVHITRDELAELAGKVDALMEEFQERRFDPGARPAGTRPVQIVQWALPDPFDDGG